jgi:polysaccharide biosynthesis protein PslH
LATVLSVVPFHVVPPQSGGQNNITGFNDFLGRKHKVLLLSTPLNAAQHSYPFTIYPVFSKSRLRYVNLFKAFSIARFCRQQKVNYIIAEQPFICMLVYLVSKMTGIPFYLHSHNIEYERARTTGKGWWKLLKPYESWAMRKADAIFFITDYDRDVAIKQFNLYPSKCHLVPYGIYHDEVIEINTDNRNAIAARHGIAADEKFLLFFGLLNYQPNTVAVDFILEKINPLLLNQPAFKYKILICGKGLPERFKGLRDQQNIIHVGFVENIDEYIQHADVILNPVTTGGGIKTKVVEAISFNKNVVSTRTGAIGIDENICGGKLLLSADDDWKSFADNIVRASSLQIDTPASFFEMFAWKNIIARLSPLFS